MGESKTVAREPPEYHSRTAEVSALYFRKSMVRIF